MVISVCAVDEGCRTNGTEGAARVPPVRAGRRGERSSNTSEVQVGSANRLERDGAAHRAVIVERVAAGPRAGAEAVKWRQGALSRDLATDDVRLDTMDEESELHPVRVEPRLQVFERAAPVLATPRTRTRTQPVAEPVEPGDRMLVIAGTGTVGAMIGLLLMLFSGYGTV